MVEQKGAFTVALSGDSIPKVLYSLLADDASLRSRIADEAASGLLDRATIAVTQIAATG